MKYLIFLLLLLIAVPDIHAQRWDVLSTWPEEQLIRIDEFSQDDSSPAEERAILYLLNLARTDGPRFSQTILQRFIDSTDYESNSYLVSLKSDLLNVKDLPLLKSDSLLRVIAVGHAKKMGVRGKVGHDGFSDRYKPALKKGRMVAENCFYGPDSPLIIVVELLIDEGVTDLGHRKNILDPNFTHVGIGVEQHKEYGYNCVMSFAQYVN